jgi:DNA-binding PadR family transcriptional regulator
MIYTITEKGDDELNRLQHSLNCADPLEFAREQILKVAENEGCDKECFLWWFGSTEDLQKIGPNIEYRETQATFVWITKNFDEIISGMVNDGLMSTSGAKSPDPEEPGAQITEPGELTRHENLKKWAITEEGQKHIAVKEYSRDPLHASMMKILCDLTNVEYTLADISTPAGSRRANANFFWMLKHFDEITCLMKKCEWIKPLGSP